MRAFNVFLNDKEIDTVFYSSGANVDADEVRRSLIGHDGYDPSIEVVEEAPAEPREALRKRYRVTYTLTAFVEAVSEEAARQEVESYQVTDYDSSDLEIEEDEDAI